MHRRENLSSWLQAVWLLPRWSCWADDQKSVLSIIQKVTSSNISEVQTLSCRRCEYLNRKDSFSESRQTTNFDVKEVGESIILGAFLTD